MQRLLADVECLVVVTTVTGIWEYFNMIRHRQRKDAYDRPMGEDCPAQRAVLGEGGEQQGRRRGRGNKLRARPTI